LKRKKSDLFSGEQFDSFSCDLSGKSNSLVARFSVFESEFQSRQFVSRDRCIATGFRGEEEEEQEEKQIVLL
jgi:hypothetical protein